MKKLIKLLAALALALSLTVIAAGAGILLVAVLGGLAFARSRRRNA